MCPFRRHYRYYAVRAEFCTELERYDEAAENYRRALSLTELDSERRFLQGRLKRGGRNRTDEELGSRVAGGFDNE